MNVITSRRRRLLSAFAKVDLESFKETFDVSDELMSDLVRMIEENKRKKKEADLSYRAKHREEILARNSKEKEKLNAYRSALYRKQMQDPAYRARVAAKARERYHNDPDYRARVAEAHRKYREKNKHKKESQT